MSKILISYIHYPVGMGRYLKAAFLRLGHQVISVGPAMGGYIPWLPEADFSRWEDVPNVALDIDRKMLDGNALVVDVGTLVNDLKPDLFVQIDANFFIDGKFPCPNVCVAIDNHVRDYNQIDFDYFFGAHSWGAKGKRPEIFRWLPCAYDPTQFFEVDGTIRDFDGLMVGVVYPKRVELVNRLYQISKKTTGFCGLLYSDYRAAYNSTKISLVYSANKDVACRIFESAAMGAVVLADKAIDMPALGLIDGENILTYETFEEAEAKYKDILLDAHKRNEIRKKALEWVKPHRWEDRAQTILDTVFKKEDTNENSF